MNLAGSQIGGLGSLWFQQHIGVVSMSFAARLSSFRPGRVLLRHGIAAALVAVLGAAPAFAGSTSVAVAANFTDVANEIARLFKEKTGHDAVLSFGATGALYTQITQGAPFEVFLSADSVRPAQAVTDGFGVPDSVFTYAVGKLAVFSSDPARPVDETALKAGNFQKIAIANPATAPYGAAAVATMQALGVYEALTPKLVQGENITQTYQFVDTGNAELGFVALSQIAKRDGGARWIVPETLYPAILQDAVLLKTGAANEAATAFVAFLRSPEAVEMIRSFGYGISD